MLSAPRSPIELLGSPWDSELAGLLGSSEEFLLLASPFITRVVTNWVGECLSKNASSRRLRIVCLTNLRIDSILAGSLELEGVAELGKAFPGFSLIHLPSLHAKVFVADYSSAIITSGNLTDGGLRRNCEYGVSIRTPELVREVRRDFEGYAHLGAPLSIEEIGDFATDLVGLRDTYQEQNRQLVRDAGANLKARIRKAEDRVLQFRARSNTNQAVFRKTILYLLAKGSLRTSELHPLIQQIHPDLCDDSIDRVIDGVNFGKKWKHQVRSAQQALKREGRVAFDGERWSLLGA
jgi:phosphatidylserine/phosphatidylglycerophosphate/cardiolipin synthase-like enzyme